METITVVMLSGGVDSVGALYRVLKETNNSVVAHHVNFINSEKRYEAESIACSSIVSYLKKNVRDFEYNESTFIFPMKRHIGWDIITAMYIGGLVTKNYYKDDNIIELCIGDTKDDFGAYKWKSPIAQSIGLLSALEDPRKVRQNVPKIIQPVVDMTKEEIINYIPSDLFSLTWSCRVPQRIEMDTTTTFTTCGHCITCIDLKNINKYEEKTIKL